MRFVGSQHNVGLYAREPNKPFNNFSCVELYVRGHLKLGMSAVREEPDNVCKRFVASKRGELGLRGFSFWFSFSSGARARACGRGRQLGGGLANNVLECAKFQTVADFAGPTAAIDGPNQAFFHLFAHYAAKKCRIDDNKVSFESADPWLPFDVLLVVMQRLVASQSRVEG
ncbi:hypothetical protein K505DRAFT_369392 [Melanomma pulvis-pyrius CBS 109.77]|uniref:Uncharacterized protein n=1 Tax=Melanomma pulvis-pyrius CBS 109.77 TaxID=1314802 RepID=A0A6A6WNI9_9PLEO|nr:hypothetical protein K505DRAFT_369392 [Melanomma pulvis-pyrius CBS 109.77]